MVVARFPELEDALVERVRELRHARPLEPLSVVVGSGAVRTRIGDVLVRRLGAVANVRPVTLSRFAADLVAGARGVPPALLTGVPRERLVRRVIGARQRKGLAHLGPVADRPNLARALAATFADLREACVPPRGRWTAIAVGLGAGTDEPSHAAKAADLQALYASYTDALAQRDLWDDARLHSAAADAAGNDVACTHVIVYGIYDVNQAQEALVARLVASGADLFVPSAGDGLGRAAVVQTLGAAAGLDEERREPPGPGVDRDQLAALWEGATTGAARVHLRGDGTLGIVSVPDERSESREAVRAVVSALEAGAAAWDCVVVVPQGDKVPRMADALAAAGLRVAGRLPDRSPGLRLLVRLLDCLVPASGQPFARRAVLDLLTAAPLRAVTPGPGEAALWTDEARRAGVVAGRESWTERAERRSRGLEQRLAELTANGMGPAVGDDEGETIERLRLRVAASQGLALAVGALARASRDMPSRASWGAWADALASLCAAVFAPDAAAAVADASARLRVFEPVEEEVDAAEMAVAVREFFAESSVATGRIGREGVAVVTPLEMRGLCFHTVVFTGLAEGGFPVRGRPDPILDDAERRRLGEALGTRLPLAEARDTESGMLFAFACQAARERIVLLAPRTDAATGRPRLPSRVLLRLAGLAAGRPVGLDEFLTGTPLAAVWSRVGGSARAADRDGPPWVDVRERDAAVLRGMSGPDATGRREEYLAAILGDTAAAGRRLDTWRAARSPVPGCRDGILGPEARAALASRALLAREVHPTRLERYIECPFAFLVRDVIGLDAPDEPGDALEMDGREFGTLAHAILQSTFDAVIAAGHGRDGALAEVASAWTAWCAEAERRGVTGAALPWEARRDALLEDLTESVRRDSVFVGAGSRPVAVEWRFGETAGRPVGLDLPDGRRLRFAGRIDRLDVAEDGAHVVDYKTGAGTTEKRRLDARLSVQLPVYRMAVRQCDDRASASISCTYRMVTRRGGFQELALDGAEDETDARLRALVREITELVESGAFPRTTAGRCDYCDLSYACGLSDWARARKREHAALDRVRALQTGSFSEEKA